MSAQKYEQGTRVEWTDDDDQQQHGVVNGVTGLHGHLRVLYRRSDYSITRTTIPASAVTAAYPPQEAQA
jgi:hypothetical protein